MCVCGWCIFSISYIVRDSSRLGSRSNIERDRVESSSGALQRDAFKLFRCIEIVKYIYIFLYVYTTNKPNTFLRARPAMSNNVLYNNIITHTQNALYTTHETGASTKTDGAARLR